MVCTMLYEASMFVTGLGNFGIGDGANPQAPYLDQIKQAIFTVVKSHYDGIGVDFLTARDAYCRSWTGG